MNKIHGFKFPIQAHVLLLFLLMLSGNVQSADSSKEICIAFESEVVVTQGDSEITHLDMDAFLATVPEGDRVDFLESADRLGQVLTNLLLSEAMANRAIEARLLDDPEVNAQLYRQLVNELTKLYRFNFFADLELADYEARARELYLTNPKRFRAPEKVDFYHVLIPVDEPSEEVEAMEEIAVAWRAFAEQQIDIERVVREYSQDPLLEQNGGFYRDVALENLHAAIASSLSKLSEGRGISEPIRTPDGWHLVQLHKRHPIEALDWPDAKEEAIKLAREQHLTNALERKLRELQAPPQEFPEGAIRSLLERYNASLSGVAD
ncbi:peptidylprolyl isomerase [Wenzhouxiangella limi]|uniref:peptidylprolyl isomerase n=1 Tax=Wenzhouxiangella limi TaxID=2707351 RepID=A0A845V133_9GAMM|nr:peptidylprolyl isomerase [Wenzhouxiangella limi]NDY94976.1 peptidylprolyl isomerase [Wenzhouxiangella limi]